MRRLALSCVAAVLVAVPAAAQVASEADDVGASARPARGHARTTFLVSFTAREATGVHGVVESAYSAEVSRRGAKRAGCGAWRSASAGDVEAGQKVTIRLRPPGGGWCLGRYRGQVSFSSGPYCPSDKEQPCPLFPSTSRPVGHFTFRVARR